MSVKVAVDTLIVTVGIGCGDDGAEFGNDSCFVLPDNRDFHFDLDFVDKSSFKRVSLDVLFNSCIGRSSVFPKFPYIMLC